MNKAWIRMAWACMMALWLSACSSLTGDQAWRLMEQQQEQHALAQQYDTDQLRRSVPKQPELMLSLIRDTQEQGRYFASLAHIDAYLRQFGNHGDVLAMRADALRMTGQPSESEQAYRALLKTPHAARGWHGLGLLAGAGGDYLLAEQNFQKAAQLSPTQADILNDLAYARLRAGLVDKARLPLGQAAELDPGNRTIISNLALLLILQGDAVGAQRVMDQASLSEETRREIYRLSSEIHRPQARVATEARQLALPNIQPDQRRIMDGFLNPGVVN